MENKEPLFLSAPFFMVRTPLLAIENFFAFLQEDNLSNALLALFEKEGIFREAIAIASPSLHQAIIDKKNKSEKEIKQITSSLLRYFLRMSTRSTPFGIFSFVSMGEWNDKTSSFFELNQIHKRARPDMEWLLAVIDKYCLNQSDWHLLKVYTNPLQVESGGRVFLNYLRKKSTEAIPPGQKTEKNNTQGYSIRASFLTKAIFEVAKYPITITEILEKVLHQFPKVDEGKLRVVIKQLLEQQFLCFHLIPSLLTSCPLRDLLCKIPSSSIYFTDLKQIDMQIEEYNQIAIGEGEPYFKKIEDKMKSVSSSPNFVQVDTGYTGEGISLNPRVAEDLEEVAEVLWRLSCVHPLPRFLSSYHTKFSDKYGTSRVVSLLELLDEEKGLGVPENYSNITSEDGHSKKGDELWYKWLKSAWSSCLYERKKEIVLTDEILDRTLGKPQTENALSSFDLYCEIVAQSSVEIDAGNFLVQILNHSWQAGATFGRFLDLLGESVQKKMREFLEREEALETQSFYIESSYLPSSARSANVAIHSRLRRYAIDLGTVEKNENYFSLDQIYVGANRERLYLTSKDGTHELRVTTMDMLNPAYAPAPIRFIRDVSHSKYQLITSFPWKDLDNAEFLPRVRFKKTILSPAQWKVDLFRLGLNEMDKPHVIEKKFLTWADNWDLPRFLFLSINENFILLDRTLSLHIQEILSQLQKGVEVKLIEKVGQEHGQWIKTDRGTHLSEFVIPFVKNQKYCSNIPSTLPSYTPISHHCRWKVPGSEWLYVKCYLSGENENRFLVETLSSFADFLTQQDKIKKWFFIRYGDPNSHLRIRFNIEREKLPSLLKIFHDWAFSLIQQGSINNFVISSYEREVERYGGEYLIDDAETLFYHDSLAVIDQLRALMRKDISLSEEGVAALNCIDISKIFIEPLKEQIAFFSSFNIPKSELEGFRLTRNDLLKFTQELSSSSLSSDSEEAIFFDFFERRRKELKSFVEKMSQLEKQNLLTTSPSKVLASILHMHCNRLLGKEPKKEAKAMIFAQHILIALNEKENQVKKSDEQKSVI